MTASPAAELTSEPQGSTLAGRPLAPERDLLERADVGGLIDERAVLRRYGQLWLAVGEKPIADGGGAVVPSRDFLGNHVSVPVVGAGPHPRLLLSGGGVRLLAFVNPADLHAVTRARARVFDAAGSEGGARVSLPAGAVLVHSLERLSRGGLVEVEHRSQTCPLVVSGWVQKDRVGKTYTREAHAEPYRASSPGGRHHRVTGATQILAAPAGSVVAEFQSPPYGQGLPVQVEVVGRARAGHLLISYRCRGIRVRGYVKASHVMESGGPPPHRFSATFGHGGSGACEGPGAAPVRDLPRGTLLFSDGVAVAAVAAKRGFLLRVRDATSEACVSTGWGQLWFEPR